MNDDSVDDGDDGDDAGDDKHDTTHKAPEVAAHSGTLSRTRNASSLTPPPAPAAAAAAAAYMLAQQGQDAGEVTEQAHVEAVIAAASLGGDTAWNGGVKGGGAGAEQLLEGAQSQLNPKATKAVSRQEGLRAPCYVDRCCFFCHDGS